MTTMQLHTIEPVNAPRILTGALSPEVFTVSTLLSMPAVWTAVVERALPFDVLIERYLIVLLTIALLAELIRRLGDGGALLPGSQQAGSDAGAAAGLGTLYDGDPYGGSFGDDTLATDPLFADGALSADYDASPLGGFEDTTLDAPLALGGPAEADSFEGLDDLGDLPPLDLNADPFTDPA